MSGVFDDEYIALMREHPLGRGGQREYGHEVAQQGDFALLEFGDASVYVQAGNGWHIVPTGRGWSAGSLLRDRDVWLPREDQLIERLVEVGWGDQVELSRHSFGWLARGINRDHALTPEVEFYGRGASRLSALRNLLLEIERETGGGLG